MQKARNIHLFKIDASSRPRWNRLEASGDLTRLSQYLLPGALCALLAMSLTGCGGSGSASAGSSGMNGGSQSGTTGTVNTGAAEYVYVVQQPTGSSGTILQFSATSNGSASPSATITPGSQIGQVATDQFGDVYVATALDVREYSAGATGNATPVRSIPINTTTGIYSVDGLTASPTGEIVLGQDGGDVDEWSATQNGSVAPERRIPGYSQIGGGLSPVVVANQVAVDASDNIYVAPEGGPGVAEVVVFGPSANGNTAPSRTVGGTGTVSSVTVDSAGNIYTAGEVNCSLSGNTSLCTGVISEYAANASATSAPIRTITGSSTQLASLWGIRVDAVGNLYVISTTNGSRANPTILKFAAGASGNVAPVSSFTSAAWTTPDNNPSLAIY